MRLCYRGVRGWKRLPFLRAQECSVKPLLARLFWFGVLKKIQMKSRHDKATSYNSTQMNFLNWPRYNRWIKYIQVTDKIELNLEFFPLKSLNQSKLLQKLQMQTLYRVLQPESLSSRDSLDKTFIISQWSEQTGLPVVSRLPQKTFL